MVSDVWRALAGGVAAHMPLFAVPSRGMQWTVRPAVWLPTLCLCQLIEAPDESDPACQTQISMGLGSQFTTLPVNRPPRKRMTPISPVSPALSLLIFFPFPSTCPTSIFFLPLFPCSPQPPLLYPSTPGVSSSNGAEARRGNCRPAGRKGATVHRCRR